MVVLLTARMAAQTALKGDGSVAAALKSVLARVNSASLRAGRDKQVLILFDVPFILGFSNKSENCTDILYGITVWNH